MAFDRVTGHGAWSIHLQVQDDLLLAVNAPDLWHSDRARGAGG